MRQKRVFALVYRLIAFLACLAGVLNALGLFSGNFSAEILLYYTTESNLLVLTMFALLLCRTAIDIKEHGTVGPASYFERLETIVTLAITLTLVVFWGLLAPGSDLSFLFSYHNLQIHLITPLLMIFDYFLFVTPGKMKKQDPLFFALIPVAYLVQAYSVAFSGFVYSSDLGAG
ncbi:MAG: hypothetical protein LBP28_03845, partial [Coriobacteriales bacterium]|nr:hypothetical protein [Coriobacteriales bacterium]